MLSGKRRLLVTIISEVSLMLPIMSELNVHWSYIVAVTLIGVVSLYGYNREDWLRIMRQTADFLDDVADEIEGLSHGQLVSARAGQSRSVVTRGGQRLKTYQRTSVSNRPEVGERQREPEGNRDAGEPGRDGADGDEPAPTGGSADSSAANEFTDRG